MPENIVLFRIIDIQLVQLMGRFHEFHPRAGGIHIVGFILLNSSQSGILLHVASKRPLRVLNEFSCHRPNYGTLLERIGIY